MKFEQAIIILKQLVSHDLVCRCEY